MPDARDSRRAEKRRQIDIAWRKKYKAVWSPPAAGDPTKATQSQPGESAVEELHEACGLQQFTDLKPSVELRHGTKACLVWTNQGDRLYVEVSEKYVGHFRIKKSENNGREVSIEEPFAPEEVRWHVTEFTKRDGARPEVADNPYANGNTPTSIKLNPKDFDAFQEALEAPPREIPKLQELMSDDPKPIANEDEYVQAIDRVEELFGAKPNTPEGKELDELVDRVHAYEEIHDPIEPPTDKDLIEFIRGQSANEEQAEAWLKERGLTDTTGTA
jgi:hypothetical protein